MVWPYAMIVNLNQSNSQPQLRAYRKYYKHSFFARTVSELKLNFLKVRFYGSAVWRSLETSSLVLSFLRAFGAHKKTTWGKSKLNRLLEEAIFKLQY